VLVVLGRVHVDFQMNGVGLHGHALDHGRHLDAEQIMRHELHVVLHHRLADIEFLGGGGRQMGGERSGDERHDTENGRHRRPFLFGFPGAQKRRDRGRSFTLDE